MPDNDFAMFELPYEDTPKPDPKPDDKSADTVTFTKEQWDQMQANWAAERQRNTEMFAQIFQGRQAPGERMGPTAPTPQIDFTGLPHPADDPEGFQKGLGERLGQTMADVERHVASKFQQQFQQEQEANGLWDNAWKRFQEKYEDLAAFPELAQLATSQTLAELGQRQVDPMVLLRTDTEGMVDRVAEKAKALVDRIRGQQEADNRDDTGRTRMLDGAAPKRGRPPAREPSNPDDLIANIKKMQSEMRIY